MFDMCVTPDLQEYHLSIHINCFSFSSKIAILRVGLTITIISACVRLVLRVLNCLLVGFFNKFSNTFFFNTYSQLV